VNKLFLFVIAAYIFIGILEIIPIAKAGQVKELLLYLPFITAAFLLSFLLSIDVKIPSPAKPLNDLFKAFMSFFILKF
jgi:hypothetical protein